MSKKNTTTPVVNKDKNAALAAELGLDVLETTPVVAAVEAVAEIQEVKGSKTIMKAFRKMKPTIIVDAAPKKRVTVGYKAVTKQKMYEVGANSSLITFPTDRYGVTKDIKKAMVSAASRIAGDQAKKELVLEVVDMLRNHIELKFDADLAYRKKLQARQEAK